MAGRQDNIPAVFGICQPSALAKIAATVQSTLPDKSKWNAKIGQNYPNCTTLSNRTTT
jgi:hypothetical protein